MNNIWVWVGFHIGVFIMLALDLGVFNRKAHVVTLKEAAIWSTVWISLSLAFAFGIYHFKGHHAGLEFITGYLIEYSLSVDNIFVFVMIFSYFRVPAEYQHRILFWGIIGALIMRGAMIGAGVYLIQRFEWIIYIFGAFLIFTGVRMAFKDDDEIHPEHNPVLKLVRRLFPVTNHYHGQRFFVREHIPDSPGTITRFAVTPLLIVLVIVETTDLVFAVDSIPAIFSVTRDPLIVYTSNICAILGLRSLYFLLAGVIDKFHYLNYGLAAVLSFVGIKMVISGFYHVPIGVSLGVIGGALTISILASLMFPAKAD